LNLRRTDVHQREVRSLAKLLSCSLLVGCATRAERATDGRPLASVQREWHIGAEARHVEVTLHQGSCWGSSAVSRTVMVRDGEVEVLPPAASGNQYRSLGWWDVTRSLFNRGFADGDPRDAKNLGCYGRPNYSCVFELVIDGRRSEGCCNHAYAIRAAFDRLAQPGRDDAISEGQ
jgi:hypothetical protein